MWNFGNYIHIEYCNNHSVHDSSNELKEDHNEIRPKIIIILREESIVTTGIYIIHISTIPALLEGGARRN